MSASIKLGDNQKLEISAFARADDDDNNIIYLNLRKFYRTKNDKTWKPARQGMTLPLELAKKFRVKFKSVCEAASDDEDSVPVMKGKED